MKWALCALLLTLAGCQSTPAPQETSFYSFNTLPSTLEATLKPGQEFRFELEENMTTGYAWQTSEKDLPCEVKLQHAASKSNLCGAPGSVLVQASSDKKGTFQFTLDYKRHWEKNPPYRTLTVKIVVE